MRTAGAVKAQFDITPFGIKFGRAAAHNHVAGFVAGVDTDAGVTLFLGKVKVAFVAGNFFKPAADVGGLRLEFLDANTIRHRLGNPFLQAFAGSGTDAIEVKTG